MQVCNIFSLFMLLAVCCDRGWPVRAYEGLYPPAKTVFADEKKEGMILREEGQTTIFCFR
ncbi:MAG TPA: hypothetical protein DCZ04_03020 [Syntrophorhabdus aromaticivorans]|nr:hypothetical protein [Syntrophorhabdus aromaticivorans]